MLGEGGKYLREQTDQRSVVQLLLVAVSVRRLNTQD